ncbi:2OG-Fe(II) oxygenase [Dyella koreensis]|uniref:2OG-Fe(II) oxygenase n=1 Tax=Dyella koreensis TaxID=311235 RepID=A0ABW8K7Y6_9GAMM
MDAISSLSVVEEAGVTNSGPCRIIEQPLPRELGTCVLIPGFLSRAECTALIEAAEGRGFSSAELDYPPSYRNNDRQVLADAQLAAQLLSRLREELPGGIERLLPGDLIPNWKLESINERFRLCRYQPGQRFHIHQDGVHHRDSDCRSMLTFMVYLTDGDDFEGGDTLFYAAGPQAGEGKSNLVARVRPHAGSLIVFDHSIWHAGEEVTRGVKHVLRSDLLFRGAPEMLTPVNTSVSHHQGYVWTLIELDDGRVASGGRDGSIRIWHEEGALSSSLTGHSQSVLGLIEVRPGVIASISRDRTLRYWDVAEERCIRSVTAHRAAVLSIVLTSGRMIATGSADHTIRLWSEDGTLVRSLVGHDGWVWGLVNLGQDLLASASEDGSVRIWNLGSGQCIATFPTSCALRTIDAFQPDLTGGPAHLAIGDASGQVTFLSMDLSDVRELVSFKAHDAAVRRVRFLHDGVLATCGEDNRLRIWSGNPSELIHEDTHGNFVTDVIELRSGSRVSCGYDGELRWR